MSDHREQEKLVLSGTLQVMGLVEMGLDARNLEDFAEHVLPNLAAMLQAEHLLLYVTSSRLPTPRLFQYPSESASTVSLMNRCERQVTVFAESGHPLPISEAPAGSPLSMDGFELHPLWDGKGCVGLLGLAGAQRARLGPPELWDRVLQFLGLCVWRFAEWARVERQLAHLNSYLTVSSMLGQTLGLHDLLETALYCCMELSSASEASVLLLDDDKQNFQFYHVEGPAKPVLMGAKFPADRGLAGHVLQTRQSEVINDVQKDPRFYSKIDSDSGIQTRCMIAIPLVAGDEPVGVLEVLNKATESCFTEEEHRQLLTIADEIAFGIRNARIFEYVVNSYCKQRQGQSSCKGCKRPLGSWTPCVKYREAAL
jgi:GAF domain-containing protein